jgi:Helix-turn-helix domain/DnaJ domain
MKSFREQTYYELLEVRRTAQADEVRAALRRALDAYAPDSVALYALVEEDQAEALRSRLQEAARVLLDPAARAGYDRMIGPEPEDLALWAEDENSEEESTSEGPYSLTEPAHLEGSATPAPVNGTQSSLRLETRPARWPSRTTGTTAGRAPGLPSPTQRTPAPQDEAGSGRPGQRAEARSQGAQPAPETEPAAASPAAPAEERPRMPDLPPDVEFNGELLRRVREARGLTLQQVAERTRIGRSHLERVEADRYADLPPSVYLRGILVSLARELKLDATRVSKSYLLLAARSGKTEP